MQTPVRVRRALAVMVLAWWGMLTQPQAAEVATPLTPGAYAASAAAKGVVLFSVRWDRRWKCAGFENAQLRLLGFDKLPTRRGNGDEGADLVVADAPLLMTKPVFDHYAFLVEPGEYALANLHIKAAKSVSDIRFAKVGRDRLIKEGRPEGGSFSVAEGEIIYIGHFYLECYKEPSLWRFYPKDRDAFDEYLAEASKKYPELDASKVQFRLFKTSAFGYDFELK